MRKLHRTLKLLPIVLALLVATALAIAAQEPVDPLTWAFQPDRGAPATATFPALVSWSERQDAGIKYFSGTATYAKSVDAPASWFGDGDVWPGLRTT